METKKRILELAFGMFFQQGIRSITMDGIAESLGISKRTLYENFTTKEDLLKACISWQYDQSIQLRDQLERDYGDDPLEIIYRHFRNILMTLKSMHPNFLNDIQKYHAPLWRDHIKSKQLESLLYTQSIVKRGIEKGIFRSQVDAEILSMMIHFSMPLMISKAVFPETRFSLSEIFSQVHMNFIRGMATPEGLAMIDAKFN